MKSCFTFWGWQTCFCVLAVFMAVLAVFACEWLWVRHRKEKTRLQREQFVLQCRTRLEKMSNLELRLFYKDQRKTIGEFKDEAIALIKQEMARRRMSANSVYRTEI